MGGMTRAHRAGLIKYAQISGASDSDTTGLAMTAEDGIKITTDDIIIACIELAVTTNDKTDLTAGATIIAGNKITVPDSNNDVVCCWWLATNAGLQQSSPFVQSEIGTGANADTAITIAGISTTDVLISVISINDTTGAWTDQTADITITAVDTIECANSTTGEKLYAMWMDASGPKGFSALHLRFALGNLDTSPSSQPSTATITGILALDTPLSVLCLDETDGDILDDLTTVSTAAAGSLSIFESSPTDQAGAEVLVFWQKANDLD